MRHGIDPYSLSTRKTDLARQRTRPSAVDHGAEDSQSEESEAHRTDISRMMDGGARPTWYSTEEDTDRFLAGIARKMRQASDAPDNGSDDDIPAGYTYFGQLVFHDLTRSKMHHDLTSMSYHRQTQDEKQPLHVDLRESTGNLATPSLDLDTLYGGGPLLEPQLFEREDDRGSIRGLFKLGRAGEPLRSLDEPSSVLLCPFDLARIGGAASNAGTSGAIDPIIADVRNDDHPILSQMLGLLKLVHNRIVTVLRSGHGTSDPDDARIYCQARLFLARSYRFIIINDFLKRILCPEIYEDLLREKPRFLNLLSADRDSILAEFTFGASRFGHGMARQKYLINDAFADATGVIPQGRMSEILKFSSLRPKPTLPLPTNWNIDWRLFFEVDDTQPQFARPLSPMFSPSLNASRLFEDPLDDDRLRSLAFLDMRRCLTFNVASGQALARKLQEEIGDQIEFPIYHSDQMWPTQISFINETLAEGLRSKIDLQPSFYSETPLSYYLLHEAAMHESKGRKLGFVGSFIVAKTIFNALGKSLSNDIIGLDRQEDIIDAQDPQNINTMPKLINLLQESERSILRLIEKTAPLKPNDENVSKVAPAGPGEPGGQRRHRFHEIGE